jgi:hypothetical protein
VLRSAEDFCPTKTRNFAHRWEQLGQEEALVGIGVCGRRDRRRFLLLWLLLLA